MLELSEGARATAGAVLLTIVAIEFGGYFLYRTVTRDLGLTAFQRTFFRAGHAHAGVLVILGLVCLLLAEATELTGLWRWVAGTGVLAAAILMPAGFFLSAVGRGPTKPNRLVALLGLGAAVLTGGVVTLGIGLLTG